MGKKGDYIITALLAIMLIALLGVFYFYILPSGMERSFVQEPSEKVTVPLLSEEVKQSYPNMRFNHNEITYGFHAACDNEKKIKVHRAFDILEEEVAPLSFIEITMNPDILIDCSKEEIKTGENTYQAGLGGPATLNLSVYPLIVSGDVTIYGQKLECDYPVVELHEILHVFGYEHVNNSKSIMHPYLNDCDQVLDPVFVEHLNKLYSIEPRTEIYFKELNWSISKGYLHFDTKITNQGLLNAENCKLVIETEDKIIKSIDLENFEPGLTKIFSIENLKLPRRIESITIKIETETTEYNKTNNIKTFSLE